VHTTTITKADRAALENLWGDAGTWAADTWTHHNTDHFDGQLRYHGIVYGLTPHGGRLGHTYSSGRITLHPALLDPQSFDPWLLKEATDGIEVLGAAHAADVLLHEMVHVALFAAGVEHDESKSHHNTREWCDEIMRITPQLGLPPVKAAPVKPRRIRIGDKSKVVRKPLDGHLPRAVIARWPHTVRPAGHYTSDGRIRVPI
jgi:hypothetical protein